MTINKSLADDNLVEDNNLSAENSDKTEKKQWLKPESKILVISTSLTHWDSELSTVGPFPS